MRCPNCGQRLADEARKCPVCGTVIDEVVRINIPEKQAEETKISYAGEDVSGQSSGTEEHHSFETENINAKQCFPAMPMKWYKFLIYFSLILTGLSNMYTGVQAVMGMQYGTKEQSAQVYAVYPGLHILDIVYGVLLIILGVFVFIVRQQLAGYRAKGPKYLLIMYIASLVLEVFYIGAGSLLSGVNLLTSSGCIYLVYTKSALLPEIASKFSSAVTIDIVSSIRMSELTVSVLNKSTIA